MLIKNAHKNAHKKTLRSGINKIIVIMIIILGYTGTIRLRIRSVRQCSRPSETYAITQVYKLCFVYLSLGCSVISVSFIICMLTLLLIPLAGLHSCVGLDFVASSL
jgi:hypothetical protein